LRQCECPSGGAEIFLCSLDFLLNIVILRYGRTIVILGYLLCFDYLNSLVETSAPALNHFYISKLALMLLQQFNYAHTFALNTYLDPVGIGKTSRH
jgi:hypothetical protein